MTDQQLQRAGEIKREIWELPELKVNGYDKTPTILNRADAFKVLLLMYPTASMSTDGDLLFSEADALNISGIIEAKRNQLQKEFDKL